MVPLKVFPAIFLFLKFHLLWFALSRTNLALGAMICRPLSLPLKYFGFSSARFSIAF